MVICGKKQKQCLPDELAAGDCWIGLSLADSSGLLLAARVGKHTDELIEQLVVTTEGKTDCKQWNSDDWGGYERVLPPEILHYIGKDKTQRLERTNGIVRQQTGRWHRRQNKFGKLWEQTTVTNDEWRATSIGSVGSVSIADSKPRRLNEQNSLINLGLGRISLPIQQSFDALPKKN